jgi:hypothetical protein
MGMNKLVAAALGLSILQAAAKNLTICFNIVYKIPLGHAFKKK